MKKLNRKGFTLVELLAVIIILAIVVGITIPAVLTTTNSAKKKAFQTAADTAADWFDRQYQVALTGLDYAGVATLDNNFTSVCGDTGATCTATQEVNGVIVPKGATTDSSTVMAAAGLKASNIKSMNIYIDSTTGRSCVTLTAKKGGDYHGVGTSNDNGTPSDTSDDYYTQKSSNCQ